MIQGFTEFGLVFSLAIFVGIVLKLLRLPAIVGYVVVGVGLGWWGTSLNLGPLLQFASSLGVMLLLFLVGLEMDLKEFAGQGKTAVGLLLAQTVLLILLAGLGLGLLGPRAIFWGVVLSFGSTILCVKFLTERKDLSSLYGKIAVAVLVLQDVLAVILMMVLAGSGENWWWLVIRLVALSLLMIFGARALFGLFLERFIRNNEDLILFSLAWCFLVGSIAGSSVVGLTIEIGGFLAGLSLSSQLTRTQVALKIRPLKDFFLTLFFVGLGTTVSFKAQVWEQALLIALGVIIIKTIVIWLLLRFWGYSQRVAFITGLLVSQVSEFGLILASEGSRMGLISEADLTLISMVGLISLVISSLLLVNLETVYLKVRRFLGWIWRDRSFKDAMLDQIDELEDHLILVGCHRIGEGVLNHLKEIKDKVLVVDFDPLMVKKLRDREYRAVCADIMETDVYEDLNLDKASLIVSTIKDLKDNLILLSEIRKRGLKVKVVMDAESVEDARTLYKEGADYVIFPHYVGGLHLSWVIKRHLQGKLGLGKLKSRQEIALEQIFGN